MRKKGRKAFWKNIKFKYKLTIINENTLEEVVGIHVSKLNGFSVLLAACTVIFLLAAIILVFTPLRNYLPGYMNSEVRSQVVTNALKADSLVEALDRQNQYIMNIQDIFSGKVSMDTVQSIDSLTTIRTNELMNRSKEEDDFRRKYEARQKAESAAEEDHKLPDLLFFRPTKGIVMKDFAPSRQHYGVDMAAAMDESIVAAMDGKVMMVVQTADKGFLIQIQHEQNFISVYKHCGTPRKKEGDRVKGGEVIALAGTEDEGKHVSYVHFELWHEGTPIDPAKYVVF
ncbi:M23 family metallopeptidase [Bacteroides mediterraneensis]|uniref:M23 family metallopeptidase n=1 Tax=Bacteroides mediterraneensis TaxID=1841856 RepID=A0ABS2EVE5_9BACE|nr:M23 family metallopeptidase [Bacteroides mediterraneensis]MBM6758605.1 M23 family metallopeptidase [Bacteroides mediterraneensis]